MSGNIVVKGYRVRKLLEQQGMRSLYRCMHLESGHECYLTVVSVRSGPSRKLMLKRAEQSKKLYYAGLVTAREFGELSRECIFYAHDAIASYPIEQALAGYQGVEYLYKMVHYVVKTLDILDYIHRAKTAHRDIHAGCVRVTTHGRLLLEGFINARPRVEARNLLHTVNMPFLAPELFTGAPADARSDLYSIGVLLYYLVTGQVPYASNYAKLEDAKQGIVPSPTLVVGELSEGLEAIILKALGPRKNRYRSANECALDLEHFYRTRPIGVKWRDFRRACQGWIGGG